MRCIQPVPQHPVCKIQLFIRGGGRLAIKRSKLDGSLGLECGKICLCDLSLQQEIPIVWYHLPPEMSSTRTRTHTHTHTHTQILALTHAEPVPQDSWDGHAHPLQQEKHLTEAH
jgi:hypothetical protein